MSAALTATTVERAGRVALVALLLLGLGATVILAMSASPMATLVVPAATVVAVGGVLSLRRPLSGLAGTLVLSIGLLGYGGPSNVAEDLFAVYFIVYVGLWFLRRLLTAEPILRSRTDAVVALFVFGGLAGGVILGVVFGADPTMLLGETRSFVMLTLYFPIREAVRSEPKGALTVVGCLMGIGVAVALWNAYTLWTAFHSASELWQIIDVRTAYGESTLAVSFLLSMGLLASVRDRWAQAGVAAVVAVLFVGLLLTKSRGYWVATAAGGVVMAALLPHAERIRVTKLGASVVAGAGVSGAVFFGKYLQLLVAGIAKRLLTLGGATTSDISLVNRFYESAAAWARIKENPVAGYGFGVPFSRFDLIHKKTMDWSFIHNGYVGMWYKLGLWGLLLMAAAWLSCLGLSVLAARASGLRASDRIFAASCAGALVTLAIAANTSNPFLLADQALIVTLAFGIGSGLHQRVTA